MIAYYGYRDGSGEYYISVDSSKCNNCLKCVSQCPQNALEMETIMVDLEDKIVASVKEKYRKDIKYICASCDHKNSPPCVLSCEQKAIVSIWNPINPKNEIGNPTKSD